MSKTSISPWKAEAAGKEETYLPLVYGAICTGHTKHCK